METVSVAHEKMERRDTQQTSCRIESLAQFQDFGLSMEASRAILPHERIAATKQMWEELVGLMKGIDGNEMIRPRSGVGRPSEPWGYNRMARNCTVIKESVNFISIGPGQVDPGWTRV
jgi:hypothetical protein